MTNPRNGGSLVFTSQQQLGGMVAASILPAKPQTLQRSIHRTGPVHVSQILRRVVDDIAERFPENTR